MERGQHIRSGLGPDPEVRETLRSLYASRLVEHLRHNGHRLDAGDLEVHLAREFGFCYGVDRAVEYAYQARHRFPDRRIFLTGEIIHNPHVNQRLREMGIAFLSGPGAAAGGLEVVEQGDVVIVPAFGVPVRDFDGLYRKGATLVDTTCGSVLNVWKNVERYGREGFTAVVHGKYDHEETRATVSRATAVEGRYLVLRDLEEAEEVASFLELAPAAAGRPERRAALMDRHRPSASPGFDPDRHLERVGLANQTTMLSSDSLAIQERLRRAMARRHGEESLVERFRSFDTICSATQDRQDAVVALRDRGLDLMLVIGGFNSSNTTHLVEIANRYTRAYHIQEPEDLVSADAIRHQPEGRRGTEIGRGWLAKGRLKVGITAGASTPNNRVGAVVERLLVLREFDLNRLGL